MKILIIDDEPLARRRIRETLKDRVELETSFEEASHGLEGLEKITSFDPDLVFLDIEMPQMTGLELIRMIEVPKFELIFQTAHDEFAIKAFELNACDYLLKPFSDKRLIDATQKAKSRIESELNKKSATHPIQRLNEHLVKEKTYLEKLIVKLGTKSKFIELSQVQSFSSEDHMSYVHLEKLRYAIDLSLTHLEERLDPRLFLRVHRNSILRISEITSIKGGTEAMAILRDGSEHKISRDRLKKVKEILEASSIGKR